MRASRLWTKEGKINRDRETDYPSIVCCSLLPVVVMRPLTDDETKVLFEKLANYIGKNIEQLINRPDEKCCFRLHKDRVYYVRCSIQ